MTEAAAPHAHTTQDTAISTVPSPYLSDVEAAARIFEHIDNGTTDVGEIVWRQPVEHYHSQERFDAEVELLRRLPVPYCPSAALPESGSHLAREAAGTPLVVLRDHDGRVRAYVNACRHRGMRLVDGAGCARSLSCPYHAWTYGLDGALKAIPGRDGFPGVDAADHGLVEVGAVEIGGIVYVAQNGPIDATRLPSPLEHFTHEQELFEYEELTDDANWKLLVETAQEGYHIKSLHRRSFYPYGYDNLTLVETDGPNSRITFPFQRIERLRNVAPEQRRLAGVATAVYHLFPNAIVSVLSKHTTFVVLEPVSPTETRWHIHRLVNRPVDDEPMSLAAARRDAEFVAASGQDEDRDAATAIQRTVTTTANRYLTFGLYEQALVNFHRHLALHIDEQTDR